MTAVPAARLSVSPVRRVVFGATALAAFAHAVSQLGPIAIPLWLVPDLAIVLGITREFGERGRLAPRAVPVYNALHAIPGPVVLGLAALAAGSPALLTVAALWLSHVLCDRAVGYGLRTKDGWQRG